MRKNPLLFRVLRRLFPLTMGEYGLHQYADGKRSGRRELAIHLRETAKFDPERNWYIATITGEFLEEIISKPRTVADDIREQYNV